MQDAARRQQWIAAFVTRFSLLQPGVDMEAVLALGMELWNDLGGHDPEIAAEMEQESRLDE